LSQGESETLHVVFTMDCVPPRGGPQLRGPRNWQVACSSILKFAAALKQDGMLGTFFIVPEALERFRGALEQVRDEGMELGLLCHPQISNYKACLGAYKYDRQREIVHLGRTIWEDKMGEAVSSLRAGFFSANDYTYQVLCLEGFRQANCCLPGRIDDEQYSMWQGCYPFPHHTDPLDRKIQGTMEVFEVPVTSDFEASELSRAETFTPPHLRIENPQVTEYAKALIGKHLDRMLVERVSVKTITFITRNSVAWGRPEDPHIERLHNLVLLVRSIAERRKMQLRAETMASLHEEADRRWRARWRESAPDPAP